jgi:hypothetical protein
MKRLMLCVAGLLVVPIGSATSAEKWQPTTLSPATIEKTRVATQAYHVCLDKEISALRQIPMDSRDATNIILKKCESELTPIRTALLAEQVPPKIADRLLRKRRNQALRKVFQLMMFAESQREAAATKKPVP